MDYFVDERNDRERMRAERAARMRELNERAQALKKKSLTAMLLGGIPLALQLIWEWFIAPAVFVFAYIIFILVAAVGAAIAIQYQGTIFGLIIFLIIGTILFAISFITDVIHWCMVGTTVTGFVKCILNLKRISALRREDRDGVTRSLLSTGTCFDVLGICASSYYMLMYVIWPIIFGFLIAVIAVLYIIFGVLMALPMM